MKKIESIKLSALVGHPLNRSFERTGERWEEFAESVRMHGVMEPLLVRPWVKKGTYQMLSGHRRCQAAHDCGMAEVPCRIETMDDRDALLFLVNSNMQRENPNIVEEARLVDAMVTELGMTPAEICERLSRDEEWLNARQMVFAFGDEVVEALAARDENRRLSEGAFREILKAPEPLREKAMQMVMNGVDHDEPLSEQRAREYIQFSLIPDWEEEQKWEAGAEKLKKDVAREMKKLCDKKAEPLISVLGWGKTADGVLDLVEAKELVPAERMSDAAQEQRAWVWYAEKIGVPVYVLPPDKAHRDKRVLVSRRQIMDDAAARHEHGMEWDIIPKGVKQANSPEVEKALHALDGNGEADYDEGEAVSRVAAPEGKDGIVIEQKMEHHAVINMGKVRLVAMWAIDSKSDPMDAPDFVPKWAIKLAMEGLWTDIDEICNWIVELKGGSGK